MRFVAVTSCPTGIAHTYMAAEALEKVAKERGHELRVETQGSAGVERLPDGAIAEADGAIFAADAGVRERERFAHLPFVEVGVSRAINRPAEVIEEAEAAVAQQPATAGATAGATAVPADTTATTASSTGDATPPVASPATPAAATGGPGAYAKGGVLRQWLMTGVSYMLPFVTAGGVLIALAFLFAGGGQGAIDVVEQNVFEEFSLPALLFTIGATAFGMIGPILAGFIAYAMADRPGITPGIVGGLIAVDERVNAGFLGALIAGLLAGAVVNLLKRVKAPAGLRGLLPVLFYPLIGTLIVGTLMILVIGEPIAAVTGGLTAFLEGLGTGAIILGVLLGAMMAFDMGGPVNKIAYAFSVGLISAGIFSPMAAVMAAGMTPPLGLALATAVRKSYFNQAEREAGKAAWLMGASFITEGAIPFAAADPLRVIPALVLGSAVTGGLTMAFGNTLQAPHGGVFVFPLVNNWPLYLLAILIGTVVTAVGVLVLKGIGRTARQEENVVIDGATAGAARA